VRVVPPTAAHLACLDEPVPLPHGQVTTQPSLIARMVQALRLAGGERVLQVGTGFGFQTAILALLARQVVSVERFGDLAEQARATLEAVGLGQVRVVVGDGTLDVPERAPYQAIVVAAPAPRVPGAARRAAHSRGRLLHPLGPGGRELVTAFRKEGDRLVGDAQVIPACFVPLVGAHGTPEREPGRE
jgi:protein-L-isoaspartate(D-aspartate) O-methyltransferase